MCVLLVGFWGVARYRPIWFDVRHASQIWVGRTEIKFKGNMFFDWMTGSTDKMKSLHDFGALQQFKTLETILWQSNMAIENTQFLGDFPMKTSIHGAFSIAMFDYQMVLYG